MNTGRIGGAIETGQDRYVDGGVHSLGASDVSVSMWFKTRSRHRALYLFELAPSYVPLGIHDEFRPTMYAGKTGQRISGDQTVSDGNWHHVTFQVEGEDMRLFVDGDLAAEGESGRNNFDDWRWGIGGAKLDDPGTADHFEGLIDEVMIHNHAISANEVRQLYLAPSVALDSDE